MKQSILSIFILVFFFITNFQSLGQEPSKEKYSLLWEISGNGLDNKSYLFGTMHVRDMRAFEFSDSVLIALDQCDAMATEVHFDSLYNQLLMKDIEKRMIENFYMADEDEVDESNDSKKEAKVKRKVEEDTKLKVMERLMNQEDSDVELAEVFLDAYLFKRAKNLSKELFGLETYDSQIRSMETLKNHRIDGLDSLFNKNGNDKDSTSYEMPDFETIKKQSRDMRQVMLDIYQNGDLERVEEFISLFYGGYNLELLKRNVDMLNSMNEIMPQQSLFSAVGAAHLPGEGGLIDLLRKEGYQVRKVEATFTGVAQAKMEMEPTEKWKFFQDRTSGMSLEFPVEPISTEIMAGLKMWVSSEPASGSSFVAYGLPMVFAGLGDNVKDLDEILRQRINEEGKLKILRNKRKITHGGMKGIELDVETVGFNFFEGKVRAFLAHDYFYLFMALKKPDIPSEKVYDVFFNSILIQKPEIEAENARDYTFDEKNGFKVLFNGHLDRKEMSLPVDNSSPHLKMAMSQYISTNISEGTLQMLVVTDLPPGYDYEQDSLAFQGYYQEVFGADDFSFQKGTRHDVKEKGIIGFQPSRMLYDGPYAVKIRQYLRGQRSYVLMYQKDKNKINDGAAEQFFDSMEFIDYQKEELIERSIEGVTLPVVSEAFKVFNEDELNSYTSQIYGMTSPKSTLGIQISRTEESKYFTYDHIDSLYNEYAESKNWWMKTVENKKNYSNSKGEYLIDFELHTEGLTSISRLIMIFKNNTVYEINFSVPFELKDSEQIEYIIDNISIENVEREEFGGDINNLFLRDLTEGTDEEFVKANDYYYAMDWTEKDIDGLIEALNSDFPHQEDEYYRIEQKLINSLGMLESFKADEALYKYFQNNADELFATDALVYALKSDSLKLNTLETIQEFPNIELNHYDVNSIIRSQIEKDLPKFKDELKDYVDLMSSYTNGRIGLLSSLVENADTLKFNVDEKAYLSDMAGRFFEFSRDSLDIYFNDEEKYYETWNQTSVLTMSTEVLCLMDDNLHQKMIEDFSFQDFEIDGSNFIIYRLLNGGKVNSKEWDYVFEYGYGLDYFIPKMNLYHLSNNIPAEYLKNENFMGYCLENVVSEDWEIEISKFLGKETVTDGDHEEVLYYYLFTDSYDEKGSGEYLGCMSEVNWRHLEEYGLWDYFYTYSYEYVSGKSDIDNEKSTFKDQWREFNTYQDEIPE